KSKQPGATPLLLIHGGLGSIVDFLDHSEPLTNPPKGAQAFDVVIPSLPGVGFSGPTKDVGWNNLRIGRAFIELMGRLGYAKFDLQGGAAGAIIRAERGRLGADEVAAPHAQR